MGMGEEMRETAVGSGTTAREQSVFDRRGLELAARPAPCATCTRGRLGRAAEAWVAAIGAAMRVAAEVAAEVTAGG